MSPLERAQDLIVVLPGLLGSALARNGVPVWSGGPALQTIRTLGRSLRELTLPPGLGDEHPEDGVEPVGLMPDLHVLPGLWGWNLGYGGWLGWLQSRFGLTTAEPAASQRLPNLLPVPYDWRLSCRFNGRRLKRIVEPALDRWRAQGGPFTSAKLVFLCHSMGGLVARWYLEREGGAALTRKLITLGTPFRGALKMLDQLINGIRVGLGPMAVDLTHFARSLPSAHQLLPEYACIEVPGAGHLLKTTETELPELDAKMVADGMRFHDEMNNAAARGPALYDIHPIAGLQQRTWTTASLSRGLLEPLDSITVRGRTDSGGDGLVPRLAARPRGTSGDSPILRWIAEQHGALQNNGSVREELEGILTTQRAELRGNRKLNDLDLRTPELILAGEPLRVEAHINSGPSVALQARLYDEAGHALASRILHEVDDLPQAQFSDLPPGAYTVVVGGTDGLASRVKDVTTAVLVWARP